eukprot:2363735-Alexandrium_andersonii.AAC.1
MGGTRASSGSPCTRAASRGRRRIGAGGGADDDDLREVGPPQRVSPPPGLPVRGAVGGSDGADRDVR